MNYEELKKEFDTLAAQLTREFKALLELQERGYQKKGN
jgi:hypothetical protein